MSTHLPPLQLCLMIWAELKSVRRAMFRDREQSYYGNKALGSAMLGILNLFLWELYNELDRHQKLQSIPAASCENEALAFLRNAVLPPLSALRLHRRRFRVSSCHDLPVCQSCQTPNSAHSAVAGKFTIFLTAPPQLLSAYQLKTRFKLSLSPCGCTRGCMCISPTAAPGLHLIRPLFLSCPNRQALWVMNISQAAFQQQQVSVSVPVSSQWLWSTVLLHPKGVCAAERKWGN